MRIFGCNVTNVTCKHEQVVDSYHSVRLSTAVLDIVVRHFSTKVIELECLVRQNIQAVKLFDNCLPYKVTFSFVFSY